MSSRASETQAVDAPSIDEAIGRMERLYQVVTGREAPPADTVYAPIPVERSPAEYVDEQMSRLLDRLGLSPMAATAPMWAPPLAVAESGAEIVVRVDLPGVARDLVRVTMSGNVLSVSGTRTAAPDGEATRLTEVPTGAFRRVLVLAGVSRDAEPAARMRDGVLEVRIAREAPAPSSERAVAVH